MENQEEAPNDLEAEPSQVGIEEEPGSAEPEVIPEPPARIVDHEAVPQAEREYQAEEVSAEDAVARLPAEDAATKLAGLKKKSSGLPDIVRAAD